MEKHIQSDSGNNSIKLKGVIMEDFVQYKKPSMFLATSYCNYKCCIEANIPTSVCQNEPLAKAKTTEFTYELLFNSYIKNDISKAVVIGGLEPFEQFEEVYGLIKYFRDNNCMDDFVIYTGFYPEEKQEELEKLKQFPNIIIKFGRFKPNDKSRFDEVIGITLASENQFAQKIS